jgi:acetoin utilization deacetylase AcuC-like enzyme
MPVGIIYDPIYLKHETGEHVECPERLISIMSYLEQTKLMSHLTLVSPRPATVDELALVHHIQYINHIQSIARDGGGYLDSDTVMSPRSFEVALYAAGGGIEAIKSVLEGRVESAFALIRPPGHHATPSRAMGFCLFNNVAIAAKYAFSKYGIERLAIIDFDVHHGNGTQIALYDDLRTLYISSHQSPLYPGTGYVEESGSGIAAGTNINVPMPPGCGDNEFKQVFQQIIAPAVKRFQPQLILVSAGYDSHWSDTISQMQMSVNGFIEIMKIIKGIAGEVCQNRLVLVLEGGYNLFALAASVGATFEVLLNKDITPDPLGYSPQGRPAPNILPLIKRIKQTHGLD